MARQATRTRTGKRQTRQRSRRTLLGIPWLLPVIVGSVLVLVSAAILIRALVDDSADPPAMADDNAAAAKSLVPNAVGEPLRVFPIGAVHVVGQERFAVGLVDEQGVSVETGTVDFLFFTLANNQGTLTETLPATFQPYGVAEDHTEHDENSSGITGIFAARPTFTAPGSWGVVVRVVGDDGTVRAGQADFTVTEDSDVPARGEAAIAGKTLTSRTTPDPSMLCTADPVDNMHETSIDEALGSGKPTVVLFATPLLCSSRTCGPSLEAVSLLHVQYGDQANFVHVEIFPERDGSKPVGTMDEWRLPSEPWLFLIDAQGNVVERFEGGVGLSEIEPSVQELVDSSDT